MFARLLESMYLCTRKTKDALLEDPLAQLVEHNTFNVGVLGSSPKRITWEDARNGVLFCYVSASYADIRRFAHFHTQLFYYRYLHKVCSFFYLVEYLVGQCLVVFGCNFHNSAPMYWRKLLSLKRRRLPTFV